MFKFLKVFFRKYIFYKNYHKFILEHRLDSTMPWDVIVTDFGGEETINFGPRKESGSALYQIETLATISSRDEVNDAILITIWQWFQSLKKKKLVDNWSSQNVHFTGLNHITGITGQQINRHVKK